MASVRANNRILIEKGDLASESLSRVQRQTAREHGHVDALINQCEQLPDIVSSVDVIKTRCESILERLISAEKLLGDSWEENVITQISAWKLVRESELQTYRQSKEAELQKEEDTLRKVRDAKLVEKRNKAIARTEKMEHAASQAHVSVQEQLDASIKQGMDDYLIYGFTSKSSSNITQPPSSTSSFSSILGHEPLTGEVQKDLSRELAAVQLATLSEAKAELDQFLGNENDSSGTGTTSKQSSAHLKEDEDEGPAVKVDATTIETPEPL